MIKKSCNKFVLYVCIAMLALCALTYFSVLTPPTYVLAEDLNDSIGGGGESAASEDDEGVADFIRNHRAMTDEQLDTASQTISPITNMIGYAIGALISLTAFLIFFMTALDLLYIGFPPIRKVLYPAGAQQGGAMGGGMVGGGMMGGGMGAQQGATSTRQLISDEAVICSAMLGGGQAGGAMGGGMMGGGMGMTGMPGAQGGQQMPMKSVIGEYFKKRIVFMVLFGLCIVVLLSSALLGTGANLALWLLKLIGTLNGYVPQ